MIYVIALSAIVGALGLYYFLFKDLNYFKKHGIPYAHPILGNLGMLLFHRQPITDYIKAIYDLHPDAKYVGMYDLNKPLVVIRDPELIKAVTLKHFDTFMDHRQFVDETQDPFLGKNLAVLRGETWKDMRATLSPAFTSSKMKNMFKLMSDYGIDFSNYLAQLPPEKRTMELKEVFAKYTNDIIATCAFGVSVDSIKDPKNEFYIYGKEITVLNRTFLLKFLLCRSLPWLARLIKLRFIREKIVNFFRDVIRSAIQTREENGIVRPDMLQLMMESKGKDGKPDLTIDDMVSQAFTFFFGGFESSSTAMCFAAHEIAVNPDVQERLQNQIDQVLEDNNGQAFYEAINSMEYLDAVVIETLRMYPLGVQMDRVCLKDYELPPALPEAKSLTIKKGEGISIPVYGLHRDPKYYEKPEKFDPERFLGERKKLVLNSGAYLAFGLGPRMCLGNRFALLEIKVLLFHLLARCDLKICEKTPLPLKLGKDGLNLIPEGGFWLSIVPRKNQHRTVVVNNDAAPNTE